MFFWWPRDKSTLSAPIHYSTLNSFRSIKVPCSLYKPAGLIVPPPAHTHTDTHTHTHPHTHTHTHTPPHHPTHPHTQLEFKASLSWDDRITTPLSWIFKRSMGFTIGLDLIFPQKGGEEAVCKHF